MYFWMSKLCSQFEDSKCKFTWIRERENVGHVKMYKPATRLVVIAKELLLAADGFGRFHRHKSVSTFCVFTHQDPALLYIQTSTILLQLLLWWTEHSNNQRDKQNRLTLIWMSIELKSGRFREPHQQITSSDVMNQEAPCMLISIMIQQINSSNVTLLILTHRPWPLQYSSPVVRIHVDFLGSMLHLHDFLCGAWCGLSLTDTTLLPPELPAVDEDAETEPDDESLQIL